MAEAPEISVKLPDPPTDGITALSYAAATRLVSTSWDGAVRIHDTGNDTDNFGNAKLVWTHALAAPLLCLATDHGTLYTGALDGTVQALDVESNAVTQIGQHNNGGRTTDSEAKSSTAAAACSNVALLDASLVVTAGWDRRVHVWDVRSQAAAAATVELPGKAFCMDTDTAHTPRIAVGCSGRHTCLIDIRQHAASDTQQSIITAEMAVQGESSQKHQSRCLKFFPNGQRIAVGSVEGRVAVEWVDGRPLGENHTMPKDYAFKCHRRNDLVFPVNCIEFHPIYGTFATGGGDGTVVTWDGVNRKRLTALPAFGTSVSALAFSPDGTTLAMASSYTFEEGERDHPRDEIFVRRMLESDCQPKQKT